jgi:hypothetical protein
VRESDSRGEGRRGVGALVWGSKGLEKRKDEEVKGCRSGWLVEGKETEMGVEKGVKSDEGVWKGGGGSTDRRERVG